jgi:hypothetical protein
MINFCYLGVNFNSEIIVDEQKIISSITDDLELMKLEPQWRSIKVDVN